MTAWQPAPLLADLALAVLTAEAVLLWTRGRLPLTLAANLCAGWTLLLALRLSLSGAGWPWLAACLSAALAAHLFDLRRRPR